MSTEEEQPGTSDAPQGDQLAALVSSSKEAVDAGKPAIETEKEQKSDTSKAEQPTEQDSKPEQTNTEPSSSSPENKPTTNEEPKAEDVLSADSSSSTAEHVKTDPTLQAAKKADSSPEHQQQTADPAADTVPVAVEKEAPTPVATVRAEEDDDEEDEDDEEPGDSEEQQRRQQPQQQQRIINKQRSDGGDSYSNEEEPGHNAANQRQDQSQTPTGAQYYEDDEEDEEDEGEEPSELRQLFEPINDSQALSEDEEDGDYIPDEEVKKTIMVGSDFQAVIPEGLCRYDDALPYENEDKLLWNPTILNEQEIEDYLVKITGPAGGLGSGGATGGGAGGGGQQKGATGSTGTATSDPQSNSVYAIPLGNHLRDDEQSLYLLQQCGHNVDEALRRKRISNNAVPVPDQQMSIWSEEECRNFENGLRVHGKDFHLIQQTKVRTRSVGELVQFYYLWKKTERHDLFASKARLEKKKYNLHPGLTDHMDRFLEEQENSTGFGDRSSSPGFNSLYSSASEAKRQRLLDSKENNTASSKRSASNL
ncbi:mesoderm induction early response protein 1 [Anopheles stephensi]|uniref:mesoderm induction early response protein 1 n=1 Tax=Anopheles stephensi TaxID=30069 RepID=UPI0016588428|nr:mesoderm induction early response protein 1 [Anopheles stephensi]